MLIPFYLATARSNLDIFQLDENNAYLLYKENKIFVNCFFEARKATYIFLEFRSPKNSPEKRLVG